MELKTTRKYELKRRADRQEETRQRIVDATVALHQELGPAHTTISAIAERAGVERLTVYRHFPDDQALFGACSGQWNRAHPLPDPDPWRAEPDPVARLRSALPAIYAYFRSGEPMIESIMRDIAASAIVQETMAPVMAHWAMVLEILGTGWSMPEERRHLHAAAIGHAIEFSTWQSLTRRQGLDDATAVELMIAMACVSAVDRPACNFILP